MRCAGGGGGVRPFKCSWSRSSTQGYNVPGWLAHWRPDLQSAGAAVGSRSLAIRVWSAEDRGPLICALMRRWGEEDGGCGYQWGGDGGNTVGKEWDGVAEGIGGRLDGARPLTGVVAAWRKGSSYAHTPPPYLQYLGDTYHTFQCILRRCGTLK